jgi:delta-aminolevulinic acid dehydratase/porphobilinogen synthase
MLKAAARGWLDERAVVLESAAVMRAPAPTAS